MNPQDLVVTKVAPQCGAEVSGLNLAEPLDKEIVQALSMALAEHGVLFFRDQPMTAEQQKRL
ncbi:MAG: TauD/TfdA family dioxygenase, partial [Pirellulaceae bacterium]